VEPFFCSLLLGKYVERSARTDATRPPNKIQGKNCFEVLTECLFGTTLAELCQNLGRTRPPVGPRPTPRITPRPSGSSGESLPRAWSGQLGTLDWSSNRPGMLPQRSISGTERGVSESNRGVCDIRLQQERARLTRGSPDTNSGTGARMKFRLKKVSTVGSVSCRFAAPGLHARFLQTGQPVGPLILPFAGRCIAALWCPHAAAQKGRASL
jgi:hypothetical protein